MLVTVPEAVAAVIWHGLTLRRPLRWRLAAAGRRRVEALFGGRTVSNHPQPYRVRTSLNQAAAWPQHRKSAGRAAFGQIEAGHAAAGRRPRRIRPTSLPTRPPTWNPSTAHGRPTRLIPARSSTRFTGSRSPRRSPTPVQNFPRPCGEFASGHDAAAQQFLAFNAAYYIQQIISSQIGFRPAIRHDGRSGAQRQAGWPNGGGASASVSTASGG